MSTCCEILEILLNIELDSKPLQNFEDDILNFYNEKKRRTEGSCLKMFLVSISPRKFNY